MTGIEEKIETFLGEFRIIVPALGAIFGFQLVVAFQASFGALPPIARIANFLGVSCTALALVFLIVPAGYHRFTLKLDQSPAFLAFAQQMVSAAFVFLPIGLTMSLYVEAVQTFKDPAWAVVPAAAFLSVCTVFWWLIPMHKARHLEQR